MSQIPLNTDYLSCSTVRQSAWLPAIQQLHWQCKRLNN